MANQYNRGITYSSVVIIFNPKSTGSSEKNAKLLQTKLKKVVPNLDVTSVPTKYAGHAEELAHELAISKESLLIVSSSGDGGYHEVINGVMRAGSKGSNTICAVLPAGNANDHSRTMQDRPLWQAIKEGKVSKIDLLKIDIHSSEGDDNIRYAHSYAGLGLTPVVARELNRHKLNRIKEMRLVMRTFWKFRPIKIRRNKKELKLDSLIFTNINQMAKVLTLSKKNRPADGHFEIVMFKHHSKLWLIVRVVKAATVGLKTRRKRRTYKFQTVENMPMQLDGEVIVLRTGDSVKVTSAKKVLSTII